MSRCTPLPKGVTFDARKEKKGVTVYYVDDKGKARKEFYTLVGSADAKVKPATTVTAVANQPAPPSAAPVQNSPAPAPIPPSVAAQGVPKEKVKCNFSSTPSGADITIDGWRFVGSTPSEISLSTGTHVIVISMPGFADWKRELTVAADSVLNVTASLQKTQP